MQIKGASDRNMETARILEGFNFKTQNINESQVSSPILISSTSTQGIFKMLATPRNSISTVQDDDVDDLLAECKASAGAAIETNSTFTAPSNSQAPQSEATKPLKSIEYEKYTVDDIAEWLVLTGFYDEAYRLKTLTRHRRLKDIEKEKQQLLREEQEELQQHLVGSGSSPTAAAASKPAPSPEAAIEQENSSYSPHPVHITPLKASDQKRVHSDMKDEGSVQSEHPAKFARRESLERFQIEPLQHTPAHGASQGTEESAFRGAVKDTSHRFTRPDLFEDYTAPRTAQHAPDTRYFHIRSWNHENVRAAQQDCTWVTQKTNELTFVEAFEQSRRVILFFSVNNSKAFQGIAEMGSIPGQSQRPLEKPTY
jgi:hypothetical protein